ncbi:hypothetical protein BDV35DRAFT_202415 [Aspergillus flavus]|uniref:Uncharacterized protein n=1 Tax=Aspergillus flavus TaxID=5059 RepID=A0A5N6H0C5_ASPFL|nr:hypothetical protein BDV35DRAFT_202415 [Aspergillus flavus]
MQILSPCIVISPKLPHLIEFICLDTDGSIIAAPCHGWPSRGCMTRASVSMLSGRSRSMPATKSYQSHSDHGVYLVPSVGSGSDNERFSAKPGSLPP